MRIKLLVVIVLSFIIEHSQAQIGRLYLSPTQETFIKIGVTDINLSYSRPSMRGRKIFGELIPYNTWWRTGANRNTTIKFNEDVMVGEQRIEKGKYAIFSIPNKTAWEIIFYKKTDNWDVPTEMDKACIVATITVPAKQTMEVLEVLSISIGDFTNYQFDLNIAWENTKVTIPIKLVTKEIMEAKITKTLKGSVASDYYAAAVYEMESGKNHKRGLEFIDKAIKNRETPSWWDYRVKAILLMNLERKEDASKIAEKALNMAKKKEDAYGINEMSRILKKIKSL